MTRRLPECSLIAISILLITPARAQTSVRLPAGEGKALVQKTCAKCHGLEGVLRARNSKDGWAAIVDDMVSRGAEGTDDEIELMIDYLAKNFGRDKPPLALPRINVNKATGAELSAALLISKDAGSAIVEYREKNGPFKKWQDLEKVPGVDMKKIEREKDRLDFEEK